MPSSHIAKDPYTPLVLSKQVATILVKHQLVIEMFLCVCVSIVGL